MAKKKGIKRVYLCPYCGNNIMSSSMFSKKVVDIHCVFCKRWFPKEEVLIEKEENK